jgi:predicted nuclease with TOPRIM domain
VFDSVINYMDKFGPELLVIQFGFLVILSTLFLWLWFSNRRKYHNLKHAIPANVVKNYLDSIIQNSTALKSSLFRGGGLEVNGVPSVMPLTNLMGGESMGMSGAPSTALLEDINQKKAMIASLEAQLSSASGSQRELETKLGSSQNHLSGAENKIKELEALLAQLKNGGSGGGDAALKTELQMVTKERDEIRDRLREFEIISDDLANLKRLQQENEQLKRSLAAQGGAVPAPQAKAVDPNNILSQADVSDLLEDLGQSSPAASDDNQALEDFLSSPEELSSAEPEADSSEADMLAAMNEMTDSSEPESPDNKPKTEKTPEDLLSEFEKMLG